MQANNFALNPQVALGHPGLYRIARYAILISILLGIFSLFFYSVNEYVIFTSLGFLCFAIVLIPMAVRKNYDLLSTWSMACLSVLLGMLLRGVYIGLGYPDHETLDFLFFRGESAGYFIFPAILLVLCLCFTVAGYLWGPVRSKRRIIRKSRVPNRRRIYIFALVSLMISMAFIYIYMTLTGGFDLLNISKKRTLIESVAVSTSHRTYGALRWGAAVTMLAHLIVLADALTGPRRRRGYKFLLAGVLFIVAGFLPFYASSRGTVFIYLLLSLAVLYYSNRKVPWGKMFISIFAMIFFFQLMSVLRTSSDRSLVEVMTDQSVDVSIANKLVLNRNDLSLGKTAHIINSIPQLLEFQYGKTIGVWFVAWIPRDLWNNKPLISPGPIVGTVVYGNRRSGVPPGLVADLYWNFHIVGVIVGGFLFGWLLKYLDKRMKPTADPSLAGLVTYLYGPFLMGYLTIGSGAGYGMFNVAANTALAVFVFRLLRLR